MDPSILEIKRVEAMEDIAAQVKILAERLDKIEQKLDQALAEKPAVKVEKNK